jgi:hypothetical protein
MSAAAQDIPLSSLLAIAEREEYKLHFAKWDGRAQPLDDYLRDWDLWVGWQRYRPGRNDFNRPFIFSLISFYPESDIWLFGGIWRIMERRNDAYEVALDDQASAFIGRLKIRYPYKDRTTRPFLEKHYDRMVVSELLRERYSGRRFPGFQNLAVSFAEMEAVVATSRPDWKETLELAKGVYLVTDALSGRRYVGAAYGDSGIWARWSAYVESGHGGNVQLRALVDQFGVDYCRANFRFALLEQHPTSVSEATVLAREAFWKGVLLSRGEMGFNSN